MKDTLYLTLEELEKIKSCNKEQIVFLLQENDWYLQPLEVQDAIKHINVTHIFENEEKGNTYLDRVNPVPYITNAALGYKQYAWLLRLNKSENGYNYLCIDSNCQNDMYIVGDIVEDLEDFYVSRDYSYNMEQNNFYGSLFQYFNITLKE